MLSLQIRIINRTIYSACFTYEFRADIFNQINVFLMETKKNNFKYLKQHAIFFFLKCIKLISNSVFRSITVICIVKKTFFFQKEALLHRK